MRFLKLVHWITANYSKFRTWGFAGVHGMVEREWMLYKMRRRIARLAEKPARGVPEKGITLIVNFTSQAALSKTMRDFATMLKKSGVPFQVFDLNEQATIPVEDYKSLLTPIEEFDFHRYTHIVQLYRSIVPKKTKERQARIVFHDSAAGILEAMPFLDTEDEIIALSDFNYHYFKQALKRSRVHKITYPFLNAKKDRLPRAEVRTKYGFSVDDFIVFFNFDAGTYYRKNPLAAIKAFAKAFWDEPRAKLLFKTKGCKSQDEHYVEMMNLAQKLGVGGQFKIITEYLPRRDLDGLTDACDVYLSLHKSEGFGIGMAEAMSLGHPVVATNWSANTEFCLEGISMPVNYQLVPIQPWEYPACMKEWAAADVEDAARKLRLLFDDPELRHQMGEKARAFVAEHYSVENFKRDVEQFLK